MGLFVSYLFRTIQTIPKKVHTFKVHTPTHPTFGGGGLVIFIYHLSHKTGCIGVIYIFVFFCGQG